MFNKSNSLQPNNYLQLASGVYLSPSDRMKNVLITGLPGTGLTRYFIDLIQQDVNAKRSVILFDQYGDISEKIIKNNLDNPEIVYIDLGNTNYPVGLNIFEHENDEEKSDICDFVINLMYDLYDPKRTGIIGPRFEHAVRTAILTIMFDEKQSFIELLRCLTDSEYVRKLIPNIKDPILINYWTKQIAQTSDFHKSEVLDYIISKLSKFVTDKKMRLIFGQTKSTINFSELLSGKKIVLFDFSKLKRENAENMIINAFLTFKLMKELDKRCGLKNESIDFYIDEVTFWPQNFITNLLTEGRRHGISLIITTIKISEIEESLRRVLFKIQTTISFRLSTEDGKITLPEFHSSVISLDEICMLKKYRAYIKSLRDGNPVTINQAVNFEKEDQEEKNINTEQLKDNSRKKYGTASNLVEEDIQKRMS